MRLSALLASDTRFVRTCIRTPWPSPASPISPFSSTVFRPATAHFPSFTGNDCVVALRALGEDTRVRIVGLLIDEALDVGEISRRLGVSQYNVSKHLRILREAGLLEVEKSGRTRLYALPETIRGRAGEGGVLDLGCCSFQFQDATDAASSPRRHGATSSAGELAPGARAAARALRMPQSACSRTVTVRLKADPTVLRSGSVADRSAHAGVGFRFRQASGTGRRRSRRSSTASASRGC